ncbi:MAG: phosphate regulon sensor histidine kinase PhoR [Gallionella sp.]|nr:phosphate regulon sensor histidine kinase PhoR [Gallionella sp.]
MQDFWLRASIPIIASATLAGLIWGLFSLIAALIAMVAMLLLLLLRQLWLLFKLEHWLNDAQLETIPEAMGVWEEAFTKLYKMVKKHKRTKQELATELKHIEQATAALPEGVAILNAANRIEWCNPLAELHFGLNAQRDILQDITYLVRQPEFISYLHIAEADAPLVMHPSRHEDMVLSIKLISYGDNKRLLISRDITQLERIEHMRRDFVANVSHELRTPLTVVNGFVENLQDMTDLSHDQVRHALGLVAEQTQRMSTLVSDLLTLSRLENEQSPPTQETITMSDLLDEVYQDGELLSHGRHSLHLDNVGIPKLQGNREELRSAFSNLVSNAVRYTPAGGHIDLRWWTRAGQPVFSVQDNGIGIAASHIPRLTERFYRVELSRSRETGGTGLGLAIVSRIAIRHQAKLEILSTEGKGSQFLLVFPLKSGESSAPASAKVTSKA